MSILLSGPSLQYLAVTSAPITTVPLTMACWFYSSSITGDQMLMTCSQLAGTHYYGLQLAGSIAGDPVRAIAIGGSGATIAATTTGYSANTWHHACGVFVSITSRTAYIDGGSSGSNTTSNTVNSPTDTAMGRRHTTSPTMNMNGRIAVATIWNVALTAEEVLLLAQRVNPTKVRPGSIVGHWPLFSIDYLVDLSGGGRNLTAYNIPVTADHIGIMPPFGFDMGGWAGAYTAVGGGGDPEGSLIGGKLIRGGLLHHGVLVGRG